MFGADRNYFFFHRLTEPDWPDVFLRSGINYDEVLGERVVNKGYDSFLPTINGQNVIEIIEAGVSRLKPREKLRVLDVGCWTGWALSDCLAKKSWQGKLALFGITAQIPGWRKKDLEDQGVRIEVNDANQLAKIFKGEKFDLIISSNSLGYMFDSFSVLKQIWELMAKDGKALVCGLYWEQERKRDLEKINHYLRKFGFPVVFKERGVKTNRQTKEEFSYLQAVMEKRDCGEKPLDLPVVSVAIKQHDPKYPAVLTYCFNPNREPSSLIRSFFSQTGNRRHAV